MRWTKRDCKGLIHRAKRPTSTFSACSIIRPTQITDFFVSLADGVGAADEMVTCLMCLGMETDEQT